MADAPSPINYDIRIVNEQGQPTQQFMRWLTDQFRSNATADSAQSAANAAQADVTAVKGINLIAGEALSGGGDLSGPDRTFALENTAVTAGTYGGPSKVAKITVDGKGRITAAVDVPIVLPSFTVSSAPSASLSGVGSMIYVTDESGGSVAAVSDGTNWRRSTDRAIIS